MPVFREFCDIRVITPTDRPTFIASNGQAHAVVLSIDYFYSGVELSFCISFTCPFRIHSKQISTNTPSFHLGIFLISAGMNRGHPLSVGLNKKKYL